MGIISIFNRSKVWFYYQINTGVNIIYLLQLVGEFYENEIFGSIQKSYSIISYIDRKKGRLNSELC